MPGDVTREEIAAYVDGALGPAEAARVAAAIAEDSDLRAYAEEVERANRLLREAFDAPLQDPVSDSLRMRILEAPTATRRAGVVDLAQARVRRRSLVRMAIAACLALMVGAGAGFLLLAPPQEAGEPLARLGPAPQGGRLHAALEHLPSGEISDAGIQPMMTFLDGDARVCREFEVIYEVPGSLEIGIACRSDAGRWQVEIVVTAPATDVGPQGYRPAAGPGADALEAMLDALDARPALSAQQEAELLGRGWQSPRQLQKNGE